MTLEATLDKQIRECERLMGRIESEYEQASVAKVKVDGLTAEITIDKSAQELLNVSSEEFFNNTLRVIEELVTQSLCKVLQDETLQLELEKKVSRNKLSVTFAISSMASGERVVTDVLSARGGGLAAVVGFFVRLVLLVASGHAKVLVLDETFAHLSEQFEPLMAEMLADMAEKMDVQIVLVTHSPVYSDYADKVYQLELEDGLTNVKVVA